MLTSSWQTAQWGRWSAAETHGSVLFIQDMKKIERDHLQSGKSSHMCKNKVVINVGEFHKRIIALDLSYGKKEGELNFSKASSFGQFRRVETAFDASMERRIDSLTASSPVILVPSGWRHSNLINTLSVSCKISQKVLRLPHNKALHNLIDRIDPFDHF